MPNSVPLRDIIKFLERNGFVLISQTGSHAKYKKEGRPTLNTIVPIFQIFLRMKYDDRQRGCIMHNIKHL